MNLNFDKSKNPMFSEDKLDKAIAVDANGQPRVVDSSDVMTVNGAVNKTMILGMIMPVSYTHLTLPTTPYV